MGTVPAGDTMMTSRRRLQAALEHREPDKVPLDLNGTLVTALTRTASFASTGRAGSRTTSRNRGAISRPAKPTAMKAVRHSTACAI